MTLQTFLKEAFSRQIDYWDDQRDHANDRTYAGAIKILRRLYRTVDACPDAVLEAFRATYDAADDCGDALAALLMRVGNDLFPESAEEFCREFTGHCKAVA